jgi:hypothetical protein
MVFGSRGLDFKDPEPLAPKSYDLPDLPWEKIAGHLERVTISIVRLDARLEASDISAGWPVPLRHDQRGTGPTPRRAPGGYG